MDGWNTSFLLGSPIFRCYVSFRECMSGHLSSCAWHILKVMYQIHDWKTCEEKNGNHHEISMAQASSIDAWVPKMEKTCRSEPLGRKEITPKRWWQVVMWATKKKLLLSMILVVSLGSLLLMAFLLQSPHSWLVFHAVYNRNNQGLFSCLMCNRRDSISRGNLLSQHCLREKVGRVNYSENASVVLLR